MQRATLALLDAFEFQLSSNANARVAIDGLCSEIRKSSQQQLNPKTMGKMFSQAAKCGHNRSTEPSMMKSKAACAAEPCLIFTYLSYVPKMHFLEHQN